MCCNFKYKPGACPEERRRTAKFLHVNDILVQILSWHIPNMSREFCKLQLVLSQEVGVVAIHPQNNNEKKH
jgi:hypothetical protein